MKSFIGIITFLIITSYIPEVRSQGCSDAGVCSINSMNPSPAEDTATIKRNTIRTGLVFGMSQYEVLVFTPYLEYTHEFGQHFTLSGKFNYGVRSGELASVNGPSDVFLSMGYTFLSYFTITVGVKIPLNDGNKINDGKPLPMNYQTSLGTTDILMGFGYSKNRWSFMAGYQQPVTQNNNQFLATDYGENSKESKYYSTRNYFRAADVILRLSFNAVRSKKITLITDLLPIYHVQNDTYQEPGGDRVTIYGSQGLTLNINVVFQYHITKTHTLELNIGAPVLSRKVRPDGLSKFAIGLGYNIYF